MTTRTRHLHVALSIRCSKDHPEMLCVECGSDVVAFFERTQSAEHLTLNVDTGQMELTISRDDREGRLTQIVEQLQKEGYEVTVKGVTFS